jgi:hypothetical protein
MVTSAMVALRKNSEFNLELLLDPGAIDNSFKFSFAVEETRDSTFEFELDPRFVFFEATCPLTTVRFLAAPEDELLRFFAATWGNLYRSLLWGDKGTSVEQTNSNIELNLEVFAERKHRS